MESVTRSARLALILKGDTILSKEQKSNKEAKKKSLLTPKEKKAAKKDKQNVKKSLLSNTK